MSEGKRRVHSQKGSRWRSWFSERFDISRRFSSGWFLPPDKSTGIGSDTHEIATRIAPTSPRSCLPLVKPE
jgi:hypothetical protein